MKTWRNEKLLVLNDESWAAVDLYYRAGHSIPFLLSFSSLRMSWMVKEKRIDGHWRMNGDWLVGLVVFDLWVNGGCSRNAPQREDKPTKTNQLTLNSFLWDEMKWNPTKKWNGRTNWSWIQRELMKLIWIWMRRIGGAATQFHFQWNCWALRNSLHQSTTKKKSFLFVELLKELTAP